ncbi:hypothetical protein RFH42_10870 [Acinetobacter rudis]|uniref:hypothetical protein n=1 Tax=Acinetobacter rudis TaxID=632955 RepID=UPI00280C710F|nr:hypothetical protein [Acinetobacter rudis]MDQ8953461.1 hypothetical protein [Acinetobacter rudis]
MRFPYLKKNGLYLSSYQEFEYGEGWYDTDADQIAAQGYSWTQDYEKAKRFVDKADLERFMRGKKGEFWDGAEMVME